MLALRLGFPDEGSLPPSRTERQAYDLVAQGFGPGINGPLVVAVDTAGDTGVLEPLRSAIAADPGVASVTEPAAIAVPGSRRMLAFPTTAPQDDATVATIERLRERTSRRCWPTVRRGPTSAARPRAGPTSGRRSATGCRCSSARSS